VSTFEDLLSTDMRGKPTGMESVVRRAVAALRAAKISFAVIGAIARGIHARRRNTEDIDFVAEPRKWKKAIVAMRAAGFKDHPDWKPDEYLARFLDAKSKLGVDLLFGVGDPEEGARQTAVPAKLFGIKVPVARPDYLLWLYLLSDQPRHHDDGLAILRTGKVDLPKLVEKLRIDGDDDALRKLKAWAVEAKESETSWVEKRRARSRARSEEE
jgi:hypothetical protein